MKLFHQEYGGGKPLVILHGLLGSLDNWHSLSKQFGEHYTVYALDQRNHGRSPHSNEMSYTTMAEDLREFLDDRGMSDVALIGHSMGGKTAMEFTLRHPSRVKALVVVDIGTKSYAAHHDHIFDALTSLHLASYKSRGDIDRALEASISNPSVRQFLMKNLRRDEQNAFQWKMNLPVLHSHYDELNREIVSENSFPGPTLFLRGVHSDYLRDEDLPAIRRLFPSARMTALDTGHWIHAEAPDKFFRTVMDFLRQSEYH